jgi:8-oxo-dGTP pyrophosphatase MutT (NUDIX family)
MKEIPRLFHIDRLDLSFVPKSWAFAVEHRVEIDAYFEKLRQEKPELWNGRVLLLHRQVVANGVFSGEYLETDYASFAAWRRWGRMNAGVHDCFSAAAVFTADGAFLLGVMGPHTFNGGKIYFPCGTPDPDDIVGAKVDLDLSVRRELREETGLDIAEFDIEPGWTMVVEGPLIAQIKVLRSSQTAAVLRSRILAYLASGQHPELIDIRVVRELSDIEPAMPAFIGAFLASRLGSRRVRRT